MKYTRFVSLAVVACTSSGILVSAAPVSDPTPSLLVHQNPQPDTSNRQSGHKDHVPGHDGTRSDKSVVTSVDEGQQARSTAPSLHPPRSVSTGSVDITDFWSTKNPWKFHRPDYRSIKPNSKAIAASRSSPVSSPSRPASVDITEFSIFDYGGEEDRLQEGVRSQSNPTPGSTVAASTATAGSSTAYSPRASGAGAVPHSVPPEQRLSLLDRFVLGTQNHPNYARLRTQSGLRSSTFQL